MCTVVLQVVTIVLSVIKMVFGINNTNVRKRGFIGGIKMNENQRQLLVAIKEALEAEPEMPSYSDYEDGLMSRKEYYNRNYDFQLVEDIKDFLRN